MTAEPGISITHILSHPAAVTKNIHYLKQMPQTEFTANDSKKENYLPIIVFYKTVRYSKLEDWDGKTAQSHPFQLHGYYYTLRQLLADLRDPIKAAIAGGML